MSAQTKSFLLARFREMGIRPATRHGQNFLIDVNLQRLIVESATLGPDDVVLEVGVGTGALTAMMAPHVAAVVGIEIDRHLFELSSDQLFQFSNVTLLHHDALKNKNRFDDRLLEAVGEQLDAAPNRQFKLVANLPYNIATPVLSNLLCVERRPVAMIATIQKELAERIVAQPWTRDYSALSIWVQCQAKAQIVRLMPPSVFWPAPNVDSAIVRIDIDEQRRGEIPDPHYFHQFVKAMFFHRRKFLRANLLGAMKKHLGKPEVNSIFTEMEFLPDVRTEQLDVLTLLQLCERVRQLAPDWKL